MVNTSLALNAIGGAISAIAGFTVAQIPTETQVGEWSKLGVAGACLSITVYLVTIHIPKILDIGKQMNEVNRQTMEKGFADLGTKIEAGNARQSQMMQTLVDKVLQSK